MKFLKASSSLDPDEPILFDDDDYHEPHVGNHYASIANLAGLDTIQYEDPGQDYGKSKDSNAISLLKASTLANSQPSSDLTFSKHSSSSQEVNELAQPDYSQAFGGNSDDNYNDLQAPLDNFNNGHFDDYSALQIKDDTKTSGLVPPSTSYGTPFNYQDSEPSGSSSNYRKNQLVQEMAYLIKQNQQLKKMLNSAQQNNNQSPLLSVSLKDFVGASTLASYPKPPKLTNFNHPKPPKLTNFNHLKPPKLTNFNYSPNHPKLTSFNQPKPFEPYSSIRSRPQNYDVVKSITYELGPEGPKRI